MIKNIYLIIIAIVVIFSSCKKKSYPISEIPTQSDFYFNGTFDGTPISLNSGINNYYMYSSYKQDSNNVYNFSADLKPSNCSNCATSLQIKINDFKVSGLNTSVQIDSSLQPKSYFFNGNYLYAVQFKSIYNQTASNYLWNFGDGFTSKQANPTHTYNALGNYSVSLRINGTNGCQQYISNIEKIRYPATNSKITLISDSLRTLKFMATTQGTAPFTYLWNFGDGTTDNSINPTHTYNINGTYPVSLRVIDATNDTTLAKYNIATQTNPMPCLTNYSITSINQVLNALALSKITINWVDAGGVVYTSNNSLQPTSSYFKIISVESYDNNEKNEATKKIKVNFNCNVYNGTTIKTISNAVAVIGISYK